MNKLVSVIMGIYNIPSKKILKESIESILNQTYKNIELIIIDDGSTNDTYKWAKELANEKIILKKNKKNIGLGKTLNECLKLAKGYYIARMDGDDISDKTRIQKQVEFLEKNKQYDLVTCNMKCFDENGIWAYKNQPEIIKKQDFLFNSPINHATLLTYKTIYEQVNGYSENNKTLRVEDYDMFMRMFEQNIKMYTMQEYLYDFREDVNAFKRRKYKYRINEAYVRAIGFKKLKLYPKAIPYVVKPLIVGLIPLKILKKIRKGKKCK